MDAWLGYLLVAVVGGGALAIYRQAKRDITIAELTIAAGTLRVVRGGLAPTIVADLEDVIAKPPVGSGRILIVRDEGRASVTVEGSLSPNQAQQVRNVVGSVPLARLMNARRRR